MRFLHDYSQRGTGQAQGRNDEFPRWVSALSDIVRDQSPDWVAELKGVKDEKDGLRKGFNSPHLASQLIHQFFTKNKYNQAVSAVMDNAVRTYEFYVNETRAYKSYRFESDNKIDGLSAVLKNLNSEFNKDYQRSRSSGNGSESNGSGAGQRVPSDWDKATYFELFRILIGHLDRLPEGGPLSSYEKIEIQNWNRHLSGEGDGRFGAYPFCEVRCFSIAAIMTQ